MHALQSLRDRRTGMMTMMMIWMVLMSLVNCVEEEQLVQGAASSEGQPVVNQPRTWTKPYIGEPSAQCKRNTGAGKLPHIPHDLRADDETIVSAALATAQSLGEHETHDVKASLSDLVSRQPHADVVNNNLLAAFYFRCPQSGAMTQLFLWGVVYLMGSPNVQMVKWHNILSFSGTLLDRARGTWVSDWDSLWCVPHDKLECWYRAYGHTRGRFSRTTRSITIYLARSGPTGSLGPQVYEFCQQIGHLPDWDRGYSCLIDDVRVYPVEGM